MDILTNYYEEGFEVSTDGDGDDWTAKTLTRKELDALLAYLPTVDKDSDEYSDAILDAHDCSYCPYAANCIGLPCHASVAVGRDGAKFLEWALAEVIKHAQK